MQKKMLLLAMGILMLNIGLLAIAEVEEENIQQAPVFVEEKITTYEERILESLETDAMQDSKKEIKSLDTLLQETLLTEEQQATLETLPQDPLEAIAFAAKKMQRTKTSS